jgi:hypothetical protein
MISQPESHEPIDPDIQELLDMLRESPPRDPTAVARGRANFLASVDDLMLRPTNMVETDRATSNGVNPTKSPIRTWINALRNQLAFTTMLTLLVFIGILFGGAGITAYASQSSLPGDALYSVKTGLELTQARLSRDASRRTELFLSFAERRLDEISTLISEKRYENIDTATQEFEIYVRRAIETLDTVAAGDPARAQELSAEISKTLFRYATILRGMLDSVPDFVKPDMEKAILSIRDEGARQFEIEGKVESILNGRWIISGKLVQTTPNTEVKGSVSIGAYVRVHGYINPDGSLIAIEIEGEDLQFENTNSNQNMNSGPDNENDNRMENGANDNQNENEDEPENPNRNVNDNDGNPSNGNSNNNTNDNDDDDGENDHSGENSNTNGNSNDDDGDQSQGNDNSDDSGGNDNDDDENGDGNDNDDDVDDDNSNGND